MNAVFLFNLLLTVKTKLLLSIFFLLEFISLNYMIYDLEYTICYYINFKYDTELTYCHSPNRFNFGIVFPLIPYLFRIIQCA